MASVFRTDTSANTTQTSPASSLRVQSSIEGMPRTIVWGITRVACNIIWYGDFYAVTVQDNSGQQGGKGGGLFGAPAAAGSSYNYYASVEMAIGEGPITTIGPAMWAGKSRTSVSEIVVPPGQGIGGGIIQKIFSGLTVSESNFGTFLGDGTQLPWSYLSTQHPDQAFSYRWTAYLAGNIALGSSAEMPNWTFEVSGPFAFAAAGIYDADPTLVIGDFLTNANYGVPGWLAAYNDDWTYARDYVFSAGLFISYAMSQQTSASSWLADLFTSLNIMPVWSESKLKLVPRGDEQIAGNGRAYFPPQAPIYDLTDADFLPNQSSFGGTNADPVSGQQKPPRNQNNIVKVEYLSRENDYNPASLAAADDGAILLYGERGSKGVNAWHWFQTASTAYMAAQLALGREQIQNQYAFTLRPRFVLLDPGDIVSITDEGLELDRQWVRILDIQENNDRSFNFLVEEYLAGTGAAPIYGTQAGTGSRPNYNADPGGINQPIFFEPTDELAGGLEVWAAISGIDLTLFGGYDAYVSYDGATYAKVPGGRHFGSARMGVTTNVLPAIAVNPAGQTIDAINNLRVDLSESGGVLSSGTQLDALKLNTACYIGGEIISYQTAELVGEDAYDLTYMVRGAYGTESLIVSHPIGTAFARIDSGILRVPYDQTRIGSSIFLKFLPFNVWGVTVSSLADVPAYTYALTGSALASPLPPVTNVRRVFEAGFTKIWWEEIEDFRQGIRYIVRKGDTFSGGQDIVTLAHPPFIAFGAGTYWIMPTCQPLAGLIVYGEDPVSITIQGNMLTTNIIQTTDFQALGWPGIFANVGKEGSDPTAVLRLVSSADILSDPDIIANPDVLNSGVIETTGSYAADPLLGLDVGYVADCYTNITWQSAGVPVGADVLGDNDILNNQDILNAASGAFVNVWIEIRFAIESSGDLFEPDDMFGPGVPDMFNSGIQWGEWQRYVPGVYRAQYMQYRALFETIDPTVIAYLMSLLVQITIPARIDHYIGNTVPIGGLTIVFMPDDAIAYKPFNGGPLVGGTGNHPLPAVSMDWSGSPGVNFVIDALSLSQVTFHFEDGTGTHVAVTGVDTLVEGY